MKTVLSAAALALWFTALASPALAQVGGNPEKIAGWVFAYEHDAAGNPVSGNLSRLDRAFEAGGDFRLQQDGEWLFNCGRVQRIDDARGLGFACTYETLNLGQLTILTDPLNSYVNQNTFGDFIIYRTSLFGGADRGATVTTNGVRWFVRVR